MIKPAIRSKHQGTTVAKTVILNLNQGEASRVYIGEMLISRLGFSRLIWAQKGTVGHYLPECN